MKTVMIPCVNPGTDLKFRVTTTKDDFSLVADLFNIVIKNRWGRVVARVLKGDCFQDSEGRWYFTVENIQEGEHYAIFVGAITDTDYGKQKRMWNDRQPLFIGGEGCCAEGRPMPMPDDSPVKYEQVWTVNLDTGEYLADSDGNFVYTGDGKRIMFGGISLADSKVRMQMTGDEFLQLIEGRNPNGTIDTLPEMLDAARGISDEETIPKKIQGEIVESDEENEASDDDIDSIFD